MTHDHYLRRDDHDSAEQAIARAPAHIRAGINAIRQRRGLAPVMSAGQRHRAAAAHAALDSVMAGGRRDPVVGLASKPPRSSRSRARCSRLVIVPAYGTATARAIGGARGEHFSPTAFGTAAAVNDRPFELTDGHGGTVLATAGEELRAFDSDIGPVIVWTPSAATAAVAKAFRALVARGGCCPVSVEFRALAKRQSRIERGADLITSAALDAVALVTDERQTAAYPGAIALLRTEQRRHDVLELKAHIDAAVAEARRRAYQARR